MQPSTSSHGEAEGQHQLFTLMSDKTQGNGWRWVREGLGWMSGEYSSSRGWLGTEQEWSQPRDCQSSTSVWTMLPGMHWVGLLGYRAGNCALTFVDPFQLGIFCDSMKCLLQAPCTEGYPQGGNAGGGSAPSFIRNGS